MHSFVGVTPLWFLKLCLILRGFNNRRTVGLLERLCFMHEGKGWGPLGGCVSVDTHNSQISRHPDYLAEMHKKDFYRHWSSFVLQHSSASVFPVHTDSAHSCVRACLYLNLRLYSRTALVLHHIGHLDLLVFRTLFFWRISSHFT